MTTDPEPTAEFDAERLERIARLQARRNATTEATPTTGTRRRRRHPAKHSRIAATALGVSAMFGLLTAYGLAAREAGPELAQVPPVASAAPEPIVVVVRLVGGDGGPITSAGPAATPNAESPPPTSTAASPAPVAESAPPVPTAAAAPAVRVLSAPSAPAPTAPVTEASTNGSR